MKYILTLRNGKPVTIEANNFVDAMEKYRQRYKKKKLTFKSICTKKQQTLNNSKS